jgi:hypothetical protein
LSASAFFALAVSTHRISASVELIPRRAHRCRFSSLPTLNLSSADSAWRIIERARSRRDSARTQAARSSSL